MKSYQLSPTLGYQTCGRHEPFGRLTFESQSSLLEEALAETAVTFALSSQSVLGRTLELRLTSSYLHLVLKIIKSNSPKAVLDRT